jgi:serine/threonine protein kinase/tetratricopeptide (TPR) repeat protein
MAQALMIAGRYQLHEELGAGGMGTVYKGTDTQTGEPVAIKLLKAEAITANPDMIERFQREGEALRQLNHPNIVKMLAALEQDSKHYLVIEYVGGGDLHDILEKEDQLPLNRLLNISIQLADALTRSHFLQIIHRDLKPANVLIAEDGTPRLTDFGVAHFVTRDRVTGTGVAVGTLDYLSPEALNGEQVDSRADIWAFGVMLIEMLTGQRPFTGETFSQVLVSILQEPVPDLEALCPNVPIALVDLIYRMLEKDPNARIRSVRLIGAELEAIMHGVATSSIRPAQIVSGEIPRFATPAPDVLDRPKHNLPAQATPFVEREHELAELTRLLNDTDIRLITILASGGMGKSRLALEMAERVVNDGIKVTHLSSLPRFANGVYFVNLAPLSTITDIVPAIAEAVGFHFHSGGEPKQQILDFLREKQMLLLMDNFEHLLEGVGLLGEILATAPGVRMLATARERLRLQEETALRIEGMDFPDWKIPEEALEYSATRLFLQSAQRAQPGFNLQPDDLQYVAAICRQVQGMPLGIVLAAAWVDALSLPEIVNEITQSLDFLETDVQNVPERHRSLRAVFNPTWNRLSQIERDVFMKLSVFRGGFTREAAQQVADAGLRQLTVLLGKSLLRRDPNSGRYDIHQLLRQYAEDCLMASPDNVTEIRDLHCSYYADFLHKQEYDLFFGRQQKAISDIETDLDNIRIAWSWACQQVKAKEISTMFYALFHGFMMLNLDMEALRMAEKAIGNLEAVEVTEERNTALAQVLSLQAAMSMRLGQIEKAKGAGERGLQLFETLNSPAHSKMIWGPRFVLGIVHVIQGDFAQAEKMGEQKLRNHETGDDKFGLAAAFYVLMIANLAQGKYEKAHEYAQQAYTNAIEAGSRWFVAYILDEWGNTARALGNYDEAKELYQKSYGIHKSFDDSQGMGAVLNHLANIALLQGDLSEAEQHYRQSVTLNRDMGNQGGIAESLEGLGNAMLGQGDYQQAEDYFIEALQTVGALVQFTLSILTGLGELWIRMGQQQRGGRMLAFVLHYPASNQEIKDRVEQLKIKLDKEAVHVVWEQGEQLDLETVVQELLTENE